MCADAIDEELASPDAHSYGDAHHGEASHEEKRRPPRSASGGTNGSSCVDDPDH